jgi:hypothetical protein
MLLIVACGGSNSKKIEVTPSLPNPVANTAPIANAGIDQQVNEGETVNLSGTGTDSESAVTYAWTQTAGPSVTLNQDSIASPSFTAPNIDTDTSVTLEISVSDDEGLTATDTVIVTIKASGSVSVNTPPTVNAGVDQTVDEGNLVQLSATGSDAEGSIVVTWEQVSGPSVLLSNSSILAPTFVSPVIDVEQAIVLQITASDELGVSVQDSVEITIQNVAANIPPEVNAGEDQQVVSGEQVSLVASASDKDGNITRYLWTQVSGDVANIVDADKDVATFEAPAVTVETELVFEVTVTDDAQASTSDRITITALPSQAKFLIGIGSPAPGLEDGFSYTYVHDIAFGADGQIALSAEARNPSNEIVEGVWLGKPDALNLIVKTNDILPNSATNILFDNATALSINGHGEVLFIAEMSGAISVTTQFILMYASDSVLKEVEVELPQELIDQGYYINQLRKSNGSKITNAGAVISYSIFKNGGFNIPSGSATWFWTTEESTLILGAYVPNNNVNDAILLPLSGTGLFNDSCIPVSHISFIELNSPRINNRGDVAFISDIASNSMNVDCPRAAIIKWNDGVYTNVVENGRPVPNMPNQKMNIDGLTLYSPSMTLAENGDIIFINRLLFPPQSLITPSLLTLFVAKENSNIEFIVSRDEHLKDDFTSSLYFYLDQPPNYSPTLGYIVPAIDLTRGESHLLAGNSIDNPYENIDDIGESHLSTLLKTGDIPPDFPSTSFFSPVDNVLATIRINQIGNLVFYSYVGDALQSNQYTGAGLWSINSEKAIQILLNIGDEVFNTNTGSVEQLAAVYDYILTDDNQIVAYVQLGQQTTGILVFNPILE